MKIIIIINNVHDPDKINCRKYFMKYIVYITKIAAKLLSLTSDLKAESHVNFSVTASENLKLS